MSGIGLWALCITRCHPRGTVTGLRGKQKWLRLKDEETAAPKGKLAYRITWYGGQARVSSHVYWLKPWYTPCLTLKTCSWLLSCTAYLDRGQGKGWLYLFSFLQTSRALSSWPFDLVTSLCSGSILKFMTPWPLKAQNPLSEFASVSLPKLEAERLCQPSLC